MPLEDLMINTNVRFHEEQMFDCNKTIQEHFDVLHQCKEPHALEKRMNEAV